MEENKIKEVGFRVENENGYIKFMSEQGDLKRVEFSKNGNVIFKEFHNGNKEWWNHDEAGTTIGVMYCCDCEYTRFGEW